VNHVRECVEDPVDRSTGSGAQHRDPGVVIHARRPAASPAPYVGTLYPVPRAELTRRLRFRIESGAMKEFQEFLSWAAMNSIPQWCTAIFASAAMGVAFTAWRTNVAVMRNAYRPVVRPVRSD
jgi:hypothetical protein